MKKELKEKAINQFSLSICLWVLLFILLYFTIMPVSVWAQFVHPGCLHKQSDMERMRYMVHAGIDPWAASYNTLRNDPQASMHYTVRGNPSWTVVARGGTNGGAFESDANAAYLNALMWIVSRDTRHADKCVEIFNTWKNLTEVTGGGTESLNAGLFAWKMVEAAEIITCTYNGWSASDIRDFKDMLVYPGYSNSAVPSSVTTNNGTFYWRIYRGDPGRHGNQDAIAWRAMISMGVFLDNQIMYDRALRYFKGLSHRPDDLPYPPGPSPSGPMIADNEYFTTYQHSPQSSTPDYGYNGVLQYFIWENGQCQESSRDQQHAMFGLGICAGIAEVAWNQGDNIWNWDNRLLKGFEFTGRYNTSYIASYPDQASPWEPADFIRRTDRTGRWFSKKINPHFENDFEQISRGDFPGKRPIYEQAAAHFIVRMNLGDQAMWTVRSRDTAVAKSGYETTGWILDHPGWGGLTFRRPHLCAGDPISGFANNLPVYKIHVAPVTIEAENFDSFTGNGEGHTYHDTTSVNSGGQYRTNVAVDIGNCSEGGYCLMDMDNGEWATYTVHIPANGTYHINIRYAAANNNGRIKFAFGGTDIMPEVTLPATSGLSNWTTYLVAPRISLNSGVQAMQMFVAGSSDSFTLNSISINEGPGTQPTEPPGALLGDVNSDGIVDIVDALLTAQYYVGLNPSNFNTTAADVDCDNSITIVDALLMAQYYVGLAGSFSC